MAPLDREREDGAAYDLQIQARDQEGVGADVLTSVTQVCVGYMHAVPCQAHCTGINSIYSVATEASLIFRPTQGT